MIKIDFEKRNRNRVTHIYVLLELGASRKYYFNPYGHLNPLSTSISLLFKKWVRNNVKYTLVRVVPEKDGNRSLTTAKKTIRR